jgi:hypothetical protein
VQCFHYIIRPAFWDHAAVEWDDENWNSAIFVRPD